MSIFDRFREISKSESVPTGPVEYLIVGLGNPGEQYAYTRHNAGFMVIDAMAERLETDVKRFKFKSLCSDVTISGKHCILMKPETYMNNSGQAVSEAMAFYKLDIEHVIIVYDDISLEPGTLRIRRKGSDGGHNGIKSIIQHTGTKNFDRLKIGIGPQPNIPSENYVLQNFSKDQLDELKTVLKTSIDAVGFYLDNGIQKAQNRFN